MRKRIFGWEIAEETELKKPSILLRLKPDRKAVTASIWALLIFTSVFFIGCWLAGNPFDSTKRIASIIVESNGWQGTNNWKIFWSVVLVAMLLEFMDSAAGMGFGTALTPLLLLFGFSPMQIVPAFMIQQGIAGLVDAFLHKQYSNVEWKLKPMSETIRLWLIISLSGCAAIAFSITAVYRLFRIAEIWIKLYVALLLVLMGIISIFRISKKTNYTPRKMIFFSALAGFNKGIGGGGYGPVVTVGGLLSGVPAKSMLAVTSLSEGTVSTFGILMWVSMAASGATLDFVLLPSLMLATMFSAIAAPYAVRVLPEKIWKTIIPIYCCIISIICFWQLIPQLIK